VRPRHRRELGRWTQTAFAVSTRRVAGLMLINRSTMTYQSWRDPQDALRRRLHQLAASRVRFGYRRLTVMLRREGWQVNPKRIYRLYTEDGLAVRTKVRKKIARRARVPMLRASRPNQKWSMDFVAPRLLDGRWFRVLTVVDQFTRECVLLLADSSLTGHKVALALSQAVVERGAPVSITVDNGTEFVSKAMDVWAYQHGVQLDFIRPGRPVENSYIESFNGRLRDECLNVEVFFTIVDVREKSAGAKTITRYDRIVRWMIKARKHSRRRGSRAWPALAPLRRRTTRRPAWCKALRPRIQNPDSFSSGPQPQ
jgi:putative transposase